MADFGERVADVLANAERYHAAYYTAEIFRGPSLYFHRRSLETRGDPISQIHLECIYATLASWGMHRMGRGGSKMGPFEEFRKSVEAVQPEIRAAQRLDYRRMREADWGILERIFRSIKIMASRTSLVGHSKVMAHMAPNIVPPIDREYTLRYLRGTTNIRNSLNGEWAEMRCAIAEFFIPVAMDAQFGKRVALWMGNQERFPWDTSTLKVIDNLVIGAGKASAR
jgi:hypothetical protein